MTKQEFGEFITAISGMYPAWARNAASEAYTDRLYESVAAFDFIDLIETARTMRRLDIDAEKPNFKALIAEAWKRANKANRLDDDGVCVRIVRADVLKQAGVDLAEWTDCEVWRWWLYTAADWRTSCALTGQAYPNSWSVRPMAHWSREFRGQLYSPSESDRAALLARYAAAVARRRGGGGATTARVPSVSRDQWMPPTIAQGGGGAFFLSGG